MTNVAVVCATDRGRSIKPPQVASVALAGHFRKRAPAPALAATDPNSYGRPTGVQIFGRGYHDPATIQIARIRERRDFAFRAPPGC